VHWSDRLTAAASRLWAKAVARTPPSRFDVQLLGMFFVMFAWVYLPDIHGHVPGIRAIDIPRGWSLALGYPVLIGLTAILLRPSGPAGSWLMRHRDLVRFAPLFALGLSVGWLIQIPSFAASGGRVTNDTVPSLVCAAQDVLQGHDPYQTNEATCMARLHVPPLISTPLQRGVFASLTDYPSAAQLKSGLERVNATHTQATSFPNFGYQPLAVILTLPVAFGGGSARVLWAVALGIVWLVAMVRAAPSRRSAILTLVLMQIGGGTILAAISQGNSEFAAVGLAALGLAWFDRIRWSSVLLAAAVAVNLLMAAPLVGAWLLATRTGHLRERLAWSFASLAVCFGPWLILYRDALSNMIALVTQPAFNLGSGLVELFGAGRIPPAWRPIFFIAFAICVIAGAWATWRYRNWAFSAPPLLLAVLWISWRSDANYLAPPLLLAVGMMIGLERLRNAHPQLTPLPAPTAEASSAGGP
jgi:hypothetical protein